MTRREFDPITQAAIDAAVERGVARFKPGDLDRGIAVFLAAERVNRERAKRQEDAA
ncbi:hypothetical protein [Nocardia sp. NPDC057227]|uniref:hypothetical protein n=1 Tax=Nocardia sp. NPDC057227 TaxID=3346056 RepID=UPI00362CA8DE